MQVQENTDLKNLSKFYLAYHLNIEYSDADAAYLKEQNIYVELRGHIDERQLEGRDIFFKLRDNSGSILLYVSWSELLDSEYEKLFDINPDDRIGVGGYVIRSRKNELCVAVDKLLFRNKNPDPQEYFVRKQKLSRLKELVKINKQSEVFPNNFRPTCSAKELHDRFSESDIAELKKTNFSVCLAGRIMNRRRMGKVTFVDFQDASGKIQLFVRRATISEYDYEKFLEFDIGDIVGVCGHVFRTRTGELSVRVENISLLVKTLRPFPEKFHGLADRELRYRRRYLDLIINEEVRNTFLTRSKIIHSIRNYLDRHQFLEVETPMMHSIPGGAIAKPFTTRHNALSLDMFLRIAPELFLKRLVVGGFERVYEINRNFRNEGLSTQHNPEFTMLEFYQAYADFEDFMSLTETLIEEIAQNVLQSLTIEYGQHSISLKKPYRRVSLLDSILEFNPKLSVKNVEDEETLRKYLIDLGAQPIEIWGIGKLQFELFEQTVEQKLIQPTFITHYPVEVSPLSRINNNDPTIADRFEFFVAGMEIANGFSELNDPEDQANRFRQQLAQRQSGDDEAMFFDDDYIRALEYGLPPTAGEGIGIDRLVMLLTNSQSIRDVILFPHLKPSSR